MSNRSPMSLPVLIALGAGALLGMSVVSGREKLPALGGPKPTLEGATPLPSVEIALGAELAEAGGRLRQTAEQVPQAIRDSLGFAPTHLSWKEDLSLDAKAYAIRLRGLVVATGQLHPQRYLALGTMGEAQGRELAGAPGTEPATGREGVWISEVDAGQARLFGHDVLDPELVLALHLDQVLRRHLFELLTREETYRLLERVKATAPRTVEDLLGHLEAGLVQKVLQNLLREQVSLRDLPLVLELVSDAARGGQDPAAITEAVRAGLARQLSAALADPQGVLYALPLGGRWDVLRHGHAGEDEVEGLIEALRGQSRQARQQGYKPVLIAPADVRSRARRLLERALPDLPVLGEHEVDAGFSVRVLNDEALAAR